MNYKFPTIFNSQLLNVHRVITIRQTEIHTAELLAHYPSPFENEIAIPKFKWYKSPGSDQIPAQLIQAGGTDEIIWDRQCGFQHISY
jgi:hypothetical protein